MYQNNKSYISINIWSKGDTYNEHCGGTVFFLHDLFHDEKGLERPFEQVSFTDGYNYITINVKIVLWLR
jgi:hypothetical protein